ncbi:hypothetical protein HYV69_00825 [Candidatus Uhrbacteria bacterium]|nr:hypothetical protein [Candidatus Uhrbacteria bacterium]
MKQFIVGLIILASSIAPFSALAAGSAEMGFSQTNVSVEKGDKFDLTVTFDAKSEKIDTVRSVVTFDPTILKAESVALIGQFNRNAPGNYIDNKTGKVFWGGFTLEALKETSGSLLKITFSAKQPGEATVAIDPESKMISNGEERINTKKLGSVKVVVAEAKSADPNLSVITVNSSTHLDESEWYPNNSVKVEWVELKGDSEITGYYYSFDETSNSDPTKFVPSTQTTADFNKVKDGIHYFHIKGVQKDGKTTKTVHRQFKVDVTKPNPVSLTVSSEQLIEGESLWLTFATTDEMSGVLQYQVALNTSAFLPQESPMELTDLKPGTYFVRVAALDRAGNVTYQGQSVRVYPEGTEIQRPEGYEQSSEINAITKSPSNESEQKNKNRNLLITIVLGALIGFGIIYAMKFKKIK